MRTLLCKKVLAMTVTTTMLLGGSLLGGRFSVQASSDEPPLLMEEESTLTSQLDGNVPVNNPAQSGSDLTPGASAAILMEQETGRVLYEKNADTLREPASITKIMTMALVFESIEAGELQYDEMVTASENAKKMGGTQINLDVGEQMSVHDLLMSVAVASANDACVALGEHLANGSEPAFVDRMNQKAKELGMENTTFVNTNGLPAEGHLTTAKDIALMSRYLLSFADAQEFIGTDRHPVRSGEQEYMMRNSNALIREYAGSIGIKTGYTDAAGHCVSGAATRDGMTLIAVILGATESKVRFAEAATLLDYGFATYQLFTPDVAIPQPEQVKVSHGLAGEVLLAAPEQSIPPLVIKRGEKPEVSSELVLEETISAPVKQGQHVGSFVVTIDEEIVYQQDYVTSQAVAKRTVIGSSLLLLRDAMTL